MKRITELGMSPDDFCKFSEMSDVVLIETLYGIRLRWYQRLCVYSINVWWSLRRRVDLKIRALILWENVYKWRT